MPTIARHIGTGDDVAGLVSYLASDAASFITGQTVCVLDIEEQVHELMVGLVCRYLSMEGCTLTSCHIPPRQSDATASVLPPMLQIR